ncbi:MAG: ATP-binding protein, partial [bacterium]
MSSQTSNNWREANQRYLTAELAVMRLPLERHAAGLRDAPQEDKAYKSAQQALQEAANAMPAPAALDILCLKFGLSSFERKLLLLCAGLELDAAFAALFAKLQNDPQRTFPTFSLAMAMLPEPNWSAITPVAPLR